ncbi:MAG: 3-mercaptopyruvate sulfurtransferase [Pseudomonadota bacterium]
MSNFGPLVTTTWLAANIGAADLKIVDGSWRMPGNGAAIDNYHKAHLPGAVFFDIDAVAARETDLPHMLPLPEAFAAAVSAMGISNSDRVVVYDEEGLFSAARVWWTFRAMGHENIAVLDGGLPKWRAEARPLTDELAPIEPGRFEADMQPRWIAGADAVRRALASGEAVLDARPADRFAGAAPEPREGLRSGHMPGAKSLPFASLIADNGTLRPRDDLAATFATLGVSASTDVITSCGSGVTAAVLSLALEVIGNQSHALYDGSWSEWGDTRHDNAVFPVVVDDKDGRPD